MISPIFAQNFQLTQHRPSSPQNPNPNPNPRHVSLLGRLINYTTSTFDSVKKINSASLAAAFDRNSQWQRLGAELTPLDQLMTHLQKFIESDQGATDGFKSYFEQLRQQFQKWNEISQSCDSLTRETQRILYLKQLANELIQLKSGQKRLISVNANLNDQLFYLFSKEGQNVTFRVLGRGESMRQLLGMNEKKTKIKKVPTSISFLRIPEKAILNSTCLEELLQCSTLDKPFDALSLSVFLEKFQEYRQRNRTENLAKKSAHCFKSIWTTLIEVDLPKSKIFNRRFYLRVELAALFNMFQDSRDTLKVDSEEYRSLESLHRTVSTEAYHAYHKEYICRDELDEIIKELTFIKEALDQASKGEIPSLGKLKNWSMHGYTQCNLEDLKIQKPSIQRVAEPVVKDLLPSVANAALHQLTAFAGFPRASLGNKDRPKDTDGLKSCVQFLLNISSRTHLIHAIYRLDFMPYKQENQGIDFLFDESSPWVKLTMSESIEVMEQLNRLSERLINQHEIDLEEHLNTFEALLKISTIVLFLNSRWFTISDTFFPNTCLLTYLKHVYGHEFDHLSYIWRPAKRIGFRLFSVSSKLPQELKKLCHLIKWGTDPLLKEQESNENAKFYIKQLDFLKRIDLVHDNSMFVPSKMEKWVRPLIHPFLFSAYLQMAMHISESDKISGFDIGLKVLREYGFNRISGIRLSNEKVDIYGVSDTEAKIMENECVTQIRRKQGMKTQEAIVDDPIAVTHFLINEMNEIISAYCKRNSIDEPLLSKSSLKFSEKEISAILLLLREDEPHTELIAFIEMHASLMDYPEIRNFVDLLFFDISLLDTLRKRQIFKNELPMTLDRKIQELHCKSLTDYCYLDQLVFFIEFNFKLVAIYDSLGYAVDAFNREGKTIIRSFLTKAESDGALISYLQSLLTTELFLFFEQQELSSEDIYQILIDYTLYHNTSGNPLNHDPALKQFINENYRWLISHLQMAKLEVGAYESVLNSIVRWKKLSIADHSSWTGEFPIFQKGSYQIDLQQGLIKIIATNQVIGGTLPNEVVLDPFFKTIYGDLNTSLIELTILESKEGISAFFFKDNHGFPCRIEGKKGEYRYYKTYPFKSGELQAVPYYRFQSSLEKEDHSFSLKAVLALLKNGLMPASIPILPYIFDHGLYVDPQQPLIGFCADPKGNLLFRVELEDLKGLGLKIKRLFDWRDNTGPWEVMCGADSSHPIVEKLSCIEHPSQILLYAQDRTLTRLELPRFGMKFELKENRIACLDPAFKGYSIDLSAAEKDKKEIAFSLLLIPSDLNQPKKLLVPESAALSMNDQRQLQMGPGISWLMWFLLSKYPSVESKRHYEVSSKEKQLSYFLLDIRPCTHELICQKDKRVQAFLEIAAQLMMLGKYELAFQTIESIRLKKSELSNPHKRFIAKFLNRVHTSTNAEAAIKLKYILQLRRLVSGDAQHDQFKHGLDTLIVQMIFRYFEPPGKLSELLKLTQKELSHILQLVKVKNPEELPLLLESATASKIKKTLSEEYLDPELKTVEELESEVKPELNLKLEGMRHSFEYVANGPCLLFSEKELEEFYIKEKITYSDIHLPNASEKRSTCEKIGLENLKKSLQVFQKTNQYRYKLTESPEKLKKLQFEILKPKLEKLRVQKEEARKAVDKHIKRSKNSQEQAAIYGKIKVMASYQDLMFALLQNNLIGLKNQGRLPSDVDCQVLQKALIAYFDCEIKLNLAEVCYTKLELMADLNGFFDTDTWETDSTILYHLMSNNRRYSPEIHPELLLFEALKFITFRQLGSQSHQLELLQNMLKSPTGVSMAATGSGKTMVLLVLRGLMKANGRNLVTQKVLPMLYKQTLDVLQKDLGDTFRKSVYPLRFDLNMPLLVPEKVYRIQKDGSKKIEIQHASIFKKMYKNMLQAIQERGCILTDYKSFPLMEEKFFKLSYEFLAIREEGEPIDEMELEHWTYLRKILILLQNREDAMMDELDQPNRPIHRIQLQLEKAIQPAKFLADESIKIYLLLANEKPLLLRENLQHEVSSKVREECLKRVAAHFAEKLVRKGVSQEEILEYILGNSEAVLSKIHDWPLDAKDVLAFYKDQFHTYLPITLSYRGKSRYARSDDGKRILPCMSGEKHEAKFGSIVEEINYTIQDYLQCGIKEIELREWMDNLLKEQKQGHQSAEERFQLIFPEFSLHKDHDIHLLTVHVNRDVKKILYFLKLRLNTLTVSGKVISMDPHNIVSMSRAVSGISATLGCAEALHQQFTIDYESAWKIRSEMLYRLVKRLDGQVKLLKYNPRHPMQLFAKSKEDNDYCALIDGAGAFVEFEPKLVAQQMAQANPKLQRIGFHKEDGSEDFHGALHAPLAFRGFYFSEPNTRGSDIALKEEGIAILTVNSQGTLERLNQDEGRMRLPGQKVIMASSELAVDLQTTQDVILAKIFSESILQSNDLFKGKQQELENVKRAEIRKFLLGFQNLDSFLNEFQKYVTQFITPAANDYQQSGSYFAINKAIRLCHCDPKTALELRRNELIAECRALGMDQAVIEYKKIHYPEMLIKKMPEKVHKIEKNREETELEVELEVECELETELEVENEEEIEFELEKEKQLGADIPYYLPRLKTEVIHSVKEKIHSAYDPHIMFTDSFLPLSRKDPLFRRKAFDPRMYRMGALRVEIEFKTVNENNRKISVPYIKTVIIGDLFDDTTVINPNDFIYDIRTNKITRLGSEDNVKVNEMTADQVISTNQFRLINTHLKIMEGHNDFIFDFRTNKITRCGSEDNVILKEINAHQLISTNQFRLIIAQIKFLDGQVEKYTSQEASLLKSWLIANDPQAMRKHFEQEVLRYRSDVLERYPLSQIWKLFQEIT